MKKSAIAGILLLIAAWCAGRPPEVRNKPADFGFADSLETTFYYTEGLKYSLIYGDTALAVSLFDKAIGLDSTHSPSYYEAANALAPYNAARALVYSEKANGLDTTNVWYRSQLGRLMVMTGRYDKALAMYEDLVKRAPHNPENYQMLAALYDANKMPFAAIMVLDSAEYKLGWYEPLVNYKRELLMQVRLFDRAIEESNRIAADNPYDEQNYVILGELYSRAGKDSLALASFDQALMLSPGNTGALIALNEFYKSRGDNLNYLSTAKQLFASDDISIDLKIEFFREITSNRDFYGAYLLQINGLVTGLVTKYPDDLRVVDLYAGHLIATGQMDQALEMYKSRAQGPSPEKEVFNNILDMESYRQRPDSVMKYTDLALRYFPNDAGFYIRKGSGMNYMKREKEARKSYQKALKYAGTDSVRSVVYGLIGDMEHMAGNAKKSYANYDKALAADPENASVLNNYAYFLSLGDDRLEDALAMSERSNRLSPSNPTFLDTWAWVLYKLGRYDEAKKQMQLAISLDRSDSMELAVHYGDILYALGENFMATVYWRRALERGYDAQEIEKRLNSMKK